MPIEKHLQWWGLQLCETEEIYEAWQRKAFSSKELQQLQVLAERKSVSRSSHDEIAFYDYSIQPSILPILYSQRYHYYRFLSSLVLPWVPPSGTLLDFGCGPGILTTFLARIFPESFFMGMDRSSECIRVAQEQAERLQLKNVKFECLDLQDRPTSEDRYEVVLSAHALLQSEGDPGIPSQSWKTYTRLRDLELQEAFERRTGLLPRLDHLLQLVNPSGKFLLYEKVGHLGRRIPFQRALASRGLQLLHGAYGKSYREITQWVDDGPFYVLGWRGDVNTDTTSTDQWDEMPTIKQDCKVFKKSGEAARSIVKRLPNKQVQGRSQGMMQEMQVEWGICSARLHYLFVTTGSGFQGVVVRIGEAQESFEPLARELLSAEPKSPKSLETCLAEHWPVGSVTQEQESTPLYENHTSSAQTAWSCFDQARILKEFTKEGQEGRQVHIELGEQKGLWYLYCANTFDQRQLVVIEPERSFLLEEYYEELFQEQIGENSIK